MKSTFFNGNSEFDPINWTLYFCSANIGWFSWSCRWVGLGWLRIDVFHHPAQAIGSYVYTSPVTSLIPSHPNFAVRPPESPCISLSKRVTVTDIAFTNKHIGQDELWMGVFTDGGHGGDRPVALRRINIALFTLVRQPRSRRGMSSIWVLTSRAALLEIGNQKYP